MADTLETIAAFVAMTLLTAVGAPRLWLCGLASLMFPPIAAFIISIASALVGNYALFAACRGRVAQRLVDWISSRRSTSGIRIPSLNVGLWDVVLLRQMPGPGALITILLARTNIVVRDFIIGSFIGFLPTTLLTVLLAGTAASYLPKDIVIWTTVGVALVAACWKFVHWAKGRVRRNDGRLNGQRRRSSSEKDTEREVSRRASK